MVDASFINENFLFGSYLFAHREVFYSDNTLYVVDFILDHEKNNLFFASDVAIQRITGRRGRFVLALDVRF